MSIIKNAVKSAEYGENNAAKEIGVSAPRNPAKILRHIDILRFGMQKEDPLVGSF
jgi:hypothetical protein